MTVLVVGSTALGIHFEDVPREPDDADYFITTGESSGVVQSWINRENVDVFSHLDLDDYLNTTKSVAPVRIASPNELYTIKVSHSYWELKNGSWDKHIYDIRWMKRRGAQLIPDLHDLLYKIWEQVHGKKRSNLYMEKEAFFNDAVTRIYDHDSIHDSVAYGKEAMYNRILKDGSTVDIDNKKMWDLTHDELVRLFREEVYATALERIVIPQDYKVSPGAAYRWALRRTITSLTKGRSAKFIVENFEEFAIPDDYVSRHLSKKDRLIKL